jgi:hypothetical protein
MQVLHLDAGQEMRGGQLQCLALLETLGNGHTLLTPSDGPLMRVARERGIKTEPFSLMSLSAASRESDLVHAHCARSHTWAAALSQTPLVVSRRVAFPPKRSVLSRWKYGRPHRYIAVSDFVRRTLIEAEVPGERISVVYDGVRIPGRTASGDCIVAPLSDDPMKGNDLLSQAADLAGFRVRYSDDLERDLPTAGLLVYITRSEGLGSAALMAMAYGVPVVASNVGGLPEIVQDGETGIITENQPEAIADAVIRALRIRESLGTNARCAVEQRYSVEHMARNTKQAYEQVLGG